LNDVNTIVTDSAAGILGAPLTSVEHGHIGDVEVAAKFLLFDSFSGSTTRRLAHSGGLRARLSVGAAYRFANGLRGSPNNFVDLGTGDGTPDIELRGYFDLVFGRRFWWSSVVRYGMPREDTATVRIADSTVFGFPAAYREQTVTLARGKYLEAEWSPRLVLNDFFAVAGHYSFRRSDEDAYSGTFAVTDLSGNERTLDAASLGAFTGIEEHRAGFALSYSTIAAYATRRSGTPVEVTLTVSRVISGAGVPADTRAGFMLRWYHRTLGGNGLRN
jgi:hypothetical protein